MDGGSGLPEVTLTKDEQAVLNRMARRTQSDPNLDPVTGVDLGSGKNGKKGGKKTRSK
jgi:Mn-containing catalase